MTHDSSPAALSGPTEDPILIVGAPRSGTTWLAKIFDSHPDVLYRHEPDDTTPPPLGNDPAALGTALSHWRDDRSIRTSAKRPFFRKSWRSRTAHHMRVALAYGMLGLGRLPGLQGIHRRWSLPDFATAGRGRLVIKTVNWCEGVACVARQMPRSRVVIIIRRPCGQVHSVMRGATQGRFELRDKASMPYNEDRAMAHAASHGVSTQEFHDLTDAAKFAWDWAAFNETLERSTDGLANVRTIMYEDLCERPADVARDIMAFTGLAWHAQTEAFIRASTSTSADGDYYGVVRNPAVAAHRWRHNMADEDRVAVQAVVRRTTLRHHWADLSASQA